MSKDLLEDFDMGLNVDGLIILLAQNLYSDANVFLRELIQNAHDAMQKRKAVDSDFGGKIEIILNAADRTITCIDNGVGMAKEEIIKHLATIGDSGTREKLKESKELNSDLANSLIGQFGIGLLSAFIVGKKVVVRTKRFGTNTSFEWHNEGSLRCQLYADDLPHYGSEVTIYLKDAFDYLLDERKLKEIVKTYCDFIPFPIYINGHGPINETDIPIYKDHWNNHEDKIIDYTLFIDRKFSYQDHPLEVIPFEIKGEFTARGVLFISAVQVLEDSFGIMDIYIKRMFIKNNDTSLLPDWAKFIRGVIDSPDLQPTAARDNIRTNHQSHQFIKDKLGEIIIAKLMELSENEIEKFENINHWHNRHLKGMACKHQKFFARVEDILLFETNKGKMSIPKYLSKSSRREDLKYKLPIYYFPHRNSSTLYNTLAQENGMTVIDAGGHYDEEFLELYTKLHADEVALLNLEIDENSIYKKIPVEEETKYRRLLFKIDQVLNGSGPNVKVKSEIRQFAPRRLAAVIINDKDYKRNKELETLAKMNVMFGSVKEIANEFIKNQRTQSINLFFNSSNSLVEKLATLEDGARDIFEEIILGLFNLAIIYSQSGIIETNNNTIYDNFISNFMTVIEKQSELTANNALIAAKDNEIEKLRAEISSVCNEKQDEEWWNAVPNETDKHIKLFVIMPFSGYENFFAAIKNVFELHPYYFEVVRADEKEFAKRILDNIIEHYKRADGFIIELSEPNANVFYELGALSPFEKKRTILNFKTGESGDLPSDLKGILYNKYSSKQKPIAELTAELQNMLIVNGNQKNESLSTLLKSRRKCYLSRNVLEKESRIVLDENEIKSILRQYVSIDDLVNADVENIAIKTGMSKANINALLDNLKYRCEIK